MKDKELVIKIIRTILGLPIIVMGCIIRLPFYVFFGGMEFIFEGEIRITLHEWKNSPFRPIAFLREVWGKENV